MNATPRPSESGPRACKVGRAGASWWATRRRLPPSASADGLSPRLRALRGPRARAPRKYCYSGWPLQPEADLQTRGRALPASPPSSGDRPGSRLPPRPPPGLSVPRRHSCHPAAPTAPVTPRESQVRVDVWALTTPTPHLHTQPARQGVSAVAAAPEAWNSTSAWVPEEQAPRPGAVAHFTGRETEARRLSHHPPPRTPRNPAGPEPGFSGASRSTSDPALCPAARDSPSELLTSTLPSMRWV